MRSRRSLILAALGGLLLLLAGGLLGYRVARSSGPSGAETLQTVARGGEPAGAGEGVPGEGRVHLTGEQQKEAGITVQAVPSRPVQGSFQATGELTGAPDMQLRVNARLPGRVTALLAEPGDRVGAGATLAVVESPRIAEARSARRAAAVRLQQARRQFDQRRRLVDLGDEIRSALDEARQEVVEARAASHSAEASLELARRQLERLASLREQGIASRQQLEQARAEHEKARAETERASARLSIAEGHLAREQAIRHQGLRVSREVTEAETEVRLAEEEVRKADELLGLLGVAPGDGDNTVAIRAPRGGVVTSRPVTLGEGVETDEELFTLLETSRLWLEVGIPERELARTRVGSPVRVRVSALPEPTFRGRIASLAPALDPATRTGRARVSIDNPDGRLRPGMFATVSVGVGSAAAGAAVPKEAVQTVDQEPVVYVALDPETFERREVQLGAEDEGWVQVVRGLSPGERIAVRGAFSVKSEDQRDTMGGE